MVNFLIFIRKVSFQRVTLEPQKKEHWDDKRGHCPLGWKPVSATFMTSS
ncbi:hypothetical protein [Wolbachia endosymbiont (group A) of Longitarsus flavicornis]